MTKLKQYWDSFLEVCKARTNMEMKRADITRYSDDSNSSGNACILVTEKYHLITTTEEETHCMYFGPKACKSTSCLMHKKNSDYVDACNKYEDALEKRKDCRRALFNIIKGYKMVKLQEYKTLCREVRIAQGELDEAKSQITKVFTIADWNKYGNTEACVNFYNNAELPWGACETVENIKQCEYYKPGELCKHPKPHNCPYKEANENVYMAQVEYINAIYRRRAFIQNILGHIK